MTAEIAEIMDDAQRKAAGKAIYETRIRPLVEPQHKGKYLALDIATGDYAIHPYRLGQAAAELLARRPNAVVYSVRVGYPTVYRFRGLVKPVKETE